MAIFLDGPESLKGHLYGLIGVNVGISSEPSAKVDVVPDSLLPSKFGIGGIQLRGIIGGDRIIWNTSIWPRIFIHDHRTVSVLFGEVLDFERA